MKLIVLVLAVIAFAVSMFLFKKGNRNKISNDQGTTKGTVSKVFFRGKLPFCEFNYNVNGTNYNKNQEVSKRRSKEIANKTYTVTYEKSNPTNAIIIFD